jgi:hypothetical protein
MMRPYHRFADFVVVDKLEHRLLCQHAEYMDHLMEHPDDIYWRELSYNPSPDAVALLQANPDKICWKLLCSNQSPTAVAILKANPTKIDWWMLSSNPKAMALLRANPDSVCIDSLCSNTCADAMVLVRQSLRFLTDNGWGYLSANCCATDLLAEHFDKIDWMRLSGNSSPEAMRWLKEYPERISWPRLSGNVNPDAVDMLRANPDKIHWYYASFNPAMFVLDYAKMTRQMAPLRDELLRNRMHPSRVYQAEHHWLLL